MKLHYAIFLIAAYAVSTGVVGQIDPQNEAISHEYERVLQERAQADALYQSEASECYKRFFVNDCLALALERKRSRLTELRRQEVLLNDAERKQKGALEVQRVEDKASADRQQAQADQRAQALQAQQDREDKAEQKEQERTERQEGLAAKRAQLGDKQQAAADKAAARARKAAQAGEKRLQLEEKEKLAAQRRADVAKRLAKKDKPALEPLPARP